MPARLCGLPLAKYRPLESAPSLFACAAEELRRSYDMGGGWRVRVTTPDRSGRPAAFHDLIVSDLIVCEPDQERALQLVRAKWVTSDRQTVTVLGEAQPEDLVS
jgi:hypothetical protein